MMAQERLPGLDGLRALAVLCVLFSHVFVSEGFPQAGWIYHLQRTFSGLFGVQVFFTISGFIITLLLYREKERDGAISSKQFWLRRALRILPPACAYLLAVQVVMMAGRAHVPAETQWASLLFWRNLMPQEPWFTSQQGFTGHYWTLSVEEQFYLFWPLLVVALPRTGLRRLALTGACLSVICRAGAPWLPEGSLRWLPMNLDGFMLGALVAAGTGERIWQRLWVWRWPLLVAALMLTRLQASALQLYVAPMQGLAVAVATAVWISGLTRKIDCVELKLLNSRPLVMLGLISYSVYLWQQLCLAPAEHWQGPVPWLARFPQNLGACIACGALSYFLIEQPCQWMKSRLMKRSRERLPLLPHASPGVH
jgi:peptidoglycan/LPS O-acetylase OafA/YrhL